MKHMMNYLINMPDKIDKQTLCVMPAVESGEVTKDNWEEIKRGKFWIINGQHSVAASKAMLTESPPILEQILKHFRTWNLLHCLLAGQGETPQDISVLQQGEPLHELYAVVVNKHPWRANDLD